MFDNIFDIAAAAGKLASGLNVADVLARHGRTAVTLAAGRIALYSENRLRRQWTPAEDAFVAESLGQLSVEEIARRLNRTTSAVKIRWTRQGMTAASRRPDEITAEQIALILGVDSKAAGRWVDEGLLPGRRLPLRAVIRVVKREVFTRWAVNPRHWVYFENSANDTSRIIDPHLRRLIELRRERWGDEWWSGGDVARHFGVDPSLLGTWIHRGRAPRWAAVKYANWRILKSAAVTLAMKPGSGSGHEVDWTDKSDRFMVLATAVGLFVNATARLMGWPSQRVHHRLKLLRESGRINDLLSPAISGDPTTGLFADWKTYRDRFPYLDRAAARFLAGDELTADEYAVIRSVMARWCYRAGLDNVGDWLTHLSVMSGRAVRLVYQQLSAWGIDPFAEEESTMFNRLETFTPKEAALDFLRWQARRATEQARKQKKLAEKLARGKRPSAKANNRDKVKFLTDDLARQWYEKWYIGEGRDARWIGKNNGIEVLSASTISRRFREVGLRMRTASEGVMAARLPGEPWRWGEPGRYSAEDDAAIVEAYETYYIGESRSFEWIACQKLTISPTHLKRRFIGLGLRLRNQSEAQRAAASSRQGTPWSWDDDPVAAAAPAEPAELPRLDELNQAVTDLYHEFYIGLSWGLEKVARENGRVKVSPSGLRRSFERLGLRVRSYTESLAAKSQAGRPWEWPE
jgi:transposase-like protein